MSAWIKIEKSLETDPRVIKLARALAVTHERYTRNACVTLVCGALARLWIFADSHIRPDDTLDLGPDDLDELLGLPGFCAMLPADWLEVIDAERVKLPGFLAHNGVEAKKRALTQKRVAQHRDTVKRSSVSPCNADALPDQDQDRDQDPRKKVPSEPLSGEAPDREVVQRVFDHWRSVHNHPAAKLDAKRRKLIRDALKAYPEADLCQAISGYKNSPHHMGQNDRSTVYDAIELLLRDAKHIDAGLRFYRDPPRTDLSKLTRANVDRTANWRPPELRDAG
jgi:hypothetical protein